uniref:Uncharacterized protein n=1 Tax=Nelumbo nucifera TaxID=4432 RepID=A0A822ZM76_NELNU|nr:TPA_asm: hypothetical protein HUJ06_001098 [Nelumbo nucifera]
MCITAFPMKMDMVPAHIHLHECIADHSLGGGFAPEVGKALAKEGIYVETCLINPPSVSLVKNLRSIGEKAGSAHNSAVFFFSNSAWLFLFYSGYSTSDWAIAICIQVEIFPQSTPSQFNINIFVSQT